MPDIELSIGASDGDVLKSLNAITAKIKEMEEATKKAGSASKEAERDGVSMGDKIGASLTRIVAGWVSVAGATALAVKGAAAYLNELNRSADVTMNIAQRAAGLAGNLGMTTAQVMGFLKAPKPEAVGMTMEQQARTLEAVSGAAPLADTETKLALSKAAMRSRMAGEEPETFGKALGGLYEVTGGKKDVGDLMDMIIKMRDLTGGRLTPDDARQLMSIGLAKGMSPESVLGMATAGVKAGFDVRAMREIVEATGPGGGISTRGMSEQGRRAYKAIGPGVSEGYARQYREAQAQDVYTRAEAGAMTGEYPAALEIGELRAQRERERMGKGMTYARRKAAAEAELGWLGDVPGLGSLAKFAETLAPSPVTKARASGVADLLRSTADQYEKETREINPTSRMVE